ncbi:hypothetical protein NQ318_015662 [Aromia moschata]|uniref:PR domain zinc finger protein 10-like n=1 Tax=Aromia moschata TaxID=1265417 RepID=A0AAV8XS86_9CUCU|nr:hypothetical protein NQ318_015662 [Aromia moschata]
MDTVVEGPPDDGAHVEDINIVDTSNWTSHNQGIVNNNSTLLYIAVEYVKDYKINESAGNMTTSQPETFTDFDPHVSPLDPNMSSVARYSPVYSEPSEFNPVVIHQLVTQDSNVQNDQFVNNLSTATSLENMPTVLCNSNMREVGNQYLQMVNENGTNMVSTNNTEGLQLAPENEQEVELLITDEATGISYSVNAQELLVERCLEDEQQLLEALAPDPLLESDLLTLDDSTLKSELHDDIDISTTALASVGTQDVNRYINNLANNEINKTLNIENSFKIETRRNRQNDLESEEQLLSCVYSITDKPILSRARASLPESYLVINRVNELENGVFAKKAIPKRTQFGPLEGVLLLNNENIKNESSLVYLIEIEGSVYKMDVSDEISSNWMSFVRKANTYEEQNLVITQENGTIYFTTTTNILPKQELKVGYSTAYAQYFGLPMLQPQEVRSWPCYECPAKFSSSEELQKHLNVHDEEKDENTRPRRKLPKNKRRLLKKCQTEVVECNICKEIFFQYNYNSLKHHITEKHNFKQGVVEDYFAIVVNYKCDTCNTGFKSEALLKIHNLEHDPDSAEEQLNHVCPACQRKFPTQRQLVMHVMAHALPKMVVQQERVKCPVCYKRFALRERLQKHMLVHGSEESKPLQCKTCNKRFLNNSALACHIKTHYIGKKVFECPICKESFDHVLKLKLHVPQHCHNNTFTCPHCKKIFKKYNIIRKHIRAFHCERKHTCQHCSKMFPTQDKLRMHLLCHSDHREFLCADCGKQFKRKDKLKFHCKRMHSEERENTIPKASKPTTLPSKKFTPKVEPTDFHRFIYKCHACLVGFKRRGMLVNHLAKRHPDISPDSVPELNLPILQTTRDYYCQYCDKVYKSSSKRKAHILKNHPGAALPMSNRKQGSLQEVSGLPNPTFSQTVGSITTRPQSCKWCHKQYASKAKLLQHQRKKHADQMAVDVAQPKAEGVSNGDVNSSGVEKVEAENCITEDFDKVNMNNMMNHEIEEYSVEEDSQYCHLSINENNSSFVETSELENPNSHLYRLLTTNNGMLPPR